MSTSENNRRVLDVNGFNEREKKWWRCINLSRNEIRVKVRDAGELGGLNCDVKESSNVYNLG